MKKFKNFLVTFFCVIVILAVVSVVTRLMVQIFGSTVYADVGSFEDYSSGSDFRRFFMG